MITKINHIAIVVNDLDVSLQAYHDLLGLPIGERKVMAEQEVEIAFLPAGDSLIELITPTTEDSGVAKYLAKRGEGIHHICLEVDDVEAALAEMKAKGAQQRADHPGRGGSRLFLASQRHPRCADRTA